MQHPTHWRGMPLPQPPPAPPPMTLYDVLRKLIGGDPWTEQERRDAYALVGDLEQRGIFGNLAAVITTPDRTTPETGMEALNP